MSDLPIPDLPIPDLVASRELLNAELPDPRFVDDRYLPWLYEQNPFGPAYQDSVDEDGVRLTHYALIPQEYRDAEGTVPGVFSLHAVTRSGTQRKGYFMTLAKQLYERAGEDGRDLAIGVPNAKSVGVGVKYLAWRLLGPMPVKVCFPAALRTPDVEDIPATPEFVGSARFEELTADLDDYPTTGITNRWTPEHLRWRLGRPHGSYVMHVSPELVGVSSRTVQRGVPASVVMKLLPRGGIGGPLSARRVIAAACRHHRTPIALYAGYNEHVPVRGVRPPRRLQPAPLYLLVRALRDGVDQDAVVLSTYEFLDIDAF
jgi:hypothetical protein